MPRFSNRIPTAEEVAEQDAEFAKQHFDFRDEPPESEPTQPSTDLKSTNPLTPPDPPKLSVEMATRDDTTITKRSCEEYVAAFRSGLLNTARSILEMCRTVYEAKTTLDYFEFQSFCHEIGYTGETSTIRKYLVIGNG